MDHVSLGQQTGEREHPSARKQTQLVVLLRGLAILCNLGADVFSFSVAIPDDGRLLPTRSPPAFVRVGLEVLQDFRLAEREARVLVLVVVRDDDVLDLREIPSSRVSGGREEQGG